MIRKIVFLCALSAVAVCNAQLPANFQKCSYGDSSCFTKMANEIISQGKTGYPEIGLGVFDPLRVDKLTIHQKEGPVNLKIDFTNFDLRGMSDIKFTKVEGFQKDFEKAKIELRFQFPVIEATGPYKLEGKVLVLPVSGDGMCNMTIYGSDVVYKILGSKIEKHGKHYLKADRFKHTFDITGARVDFQGLFGGNQKELSDTTNLFFNENWRDIFTEIKPAIAEGFGGLYSDIFDKVFGSIPYDELFSS